MFRFIFLLTLVVSALSASINPVIDQEWEGFIVGGTVAEVGQFPHQVSLRSQYNSHFCGGFIINDRWVGSAAHCTISRTTTNTVSVVGTNSRTSGGVTYKSAQIINHPLYNSQNIENDISLVQTILTIVFTSLIQPIPLGSDYVGGGINSTVSGWGQTATAGPLSNSLLFVNVPTITNEECLSRHTTSNRNKIHDTSICTLLSTGYGTCYGDSGGPLIAGGTVIGAVSWGAPCARGYPDVYSRISSYRAWMISQM